MVSEVLMKYGAFILKIQAVLLLLLLLLLLFLVLVLGLFNPKILKLPSKGSGR